MVPSGWRRLSISELAEINPPRPVRSGEIVPFVEMAAVRTDLPHIDYLGERTAAGSGSRFENGDTLFARITPCTENGKTSFVDYLPADTTGMGSTEFIVLGPRRTVVIPKYLYWLAKSELVRKPAISSMVGTSGRQRVPTHLLGEIVVPVPPLAEQRRIADILTSIDEAIQATKGFIEQTRKLKQGLLQELLTRGIGHTRFKPVTGWRIGKLPNVEKIPDSWSLVQLTQIATLASGHTPSRNRTEYWEGETPWLSLHDTKSLSRREIADTAERITQLGLDNSSARLLPAGTVAFSRTASVGHCVIMARPMATSQDFANYICGERLFNRFLMHLFRWMQPVWANLASGSTHQTVYMPIFEQIQTLLPPYDEQVRIAQIADTFDDAIECHEADVSGLHDLKRGFMQDLLTGHVRVARAGR